MPIGGVLLLLVVIVLSRRSFFETVLRSRVQTSGGSENVHFSVYGFIPHVLRTDPFFGLGLNTFSVYYEFVTGKSNWGPHSYYVALIVETGVVGAALFTVFMVWVFRRLGAARALGRRLAAARDPLAARVRPLAWGCTAALAGTLASNAFYLTMQFYYFYVFMALARRDPRRLRAARMKVVVLTTSYPRDASDVAGNFVASAVRGVRELGVEVDVVSPATFQDFGIAYGGGIAQNLRGAPWKLALVPPFLAAYARAARIASRDADLVHAHWIPSAIAARATGKPYVLQVWGTDVELARRAPALVRPLLRGARTVIAASSFLADEARKLGAERVEVVPTGVEIPEHVGEPADPPHVLYAGRLSEEKGILEFVEATRGLAARDRRRRPAARPGARGGRLRAAGAARRLLRACRGRLRPVAARGLRHDRPRGDGVRASGGRDAPSGGLDDAVVDGVTGLLVAAGRRLRRSAVQRLLGDETSGRSWWRAARGRGSGSASRGSAPLTPAGLSHDL